ncbi:MAG: hypothetical protein PCFJNLEI_00067 [Verrucomicrobiae bacterium]|nr:hypothetical protein [Verrucomicrobiae bacterium]
MCSETNAESQVGKMNQREETNAIATVVAVDFTEPHGRIRALNGVNLAPPLSVQKSGKDLNAPYKALRIPYARLHDAPLDNPGMRIVDIQHIFGNWAADAADPNSYYFEQTDDYIRNCKELGTDIIYRLGTSIEHSVKHYYAHPPADYQQWTEICLGIIRHYNEGWANGHEWNIHYWEIWNEPDIKPNMWSGTKEDYFRLYVTAAKQIKQRFPKVKVGGPALAFLDQGYIESFLSACQKEHAPLDFFSWHSYNANLEDMAQQPQRMRALLDKHGFAKSELHLNEWHYFPADWRKLTSDPQYNKEMFDGPDGLNGIDGAAYLTAVLTKWQDTPLTIGNYYTATFVWGLFQRSYAIPYKTYHSAWAFGQLLDYSNRVKAETNTQSVTVLAGTNATGDKAVLISAFQSAATVLEVHLTGIEGMLLTILRLDRDNDFVPIQAECPNGKLVLNKPAGSAVFLVKLKAP